MSGLPESCFTEYMVRENRLDQRDFAEWAFVPAMLFGAEDKWWGDQGKRGAPHEGIDLCLFADASRNLFRLGAGARIPAMHDGVVVAIIDDFLGQSIVLEHGLPDQGGSFLTVYGHVAAQEGLRAGSIVRQAEIIAALAGTGRSRVRVYPHLHLSLALPSKEAPCNGLSYDRLSWTDLTNPGLFTMIDPLSLIVGPYRVMEQIIGDPAEHHS